MNFNSLLFLTETTEIQEAIYQMATRFPEYAARADRYEKALHPNDGTAPEILWEMEDAINSVHAIQEKAAFICGMQFAWTLFHEMTP